MYIFRIQIKMELIEIVVMMIVMTIHLQILVIQLITDQEGEEENSRLHYNINCFSFNTLFHIIIILIVSYIMYFLFLILLSIIHNTI